MERLIDGDISGTLIEITHGIPTSGHYFVDKQIGIGDGGARIVDEVRLNGCPSFRKGRTLGAIQRTNT